MGIQNIDAVNWGPQLGEALGSIADSAHRMADPEFEFRQRFAHELITNPELVQHLADLEHQEPGVITKNMRQMLSKTSQGLISATPPSMQARISKIVGENSDIFARDPSLLNDLVRRTVGLPSPEEQAVGDIHTRDIAAVNAGTADTDTQENVRSLAYPNAYRGATTRYAADARANSQITAAMIRAQNAESPEEKFQAWKQRALFMNNLIAGRDFNDLQNRWSYDAQLKRPMYVNSISNAWTRVKAAQLQLRNARSDTERQGLVAGINNDMQSIDFYRGLLGETPLGVTMGPNPGAINRATGMGSDIGSGQFFQNNQPINLSDTQVIPAYQNTGPITPTPRTGNVPAPRPGGGNRPAPDANDPLQQQALNLANSSTDIDSQAGITAVTNRLINQAHFNGAQASEIIARAKQARAARARRGR